MKNCNRNEEEGPSSASNDSWLVHRGDVTGVRVKREPCDAGLVTQCDVAPMDLWPSFFTLDMEGFPAVFDVAQAITM